MGFRTRRTPSSRGRLPACIGDSGSSPVLGPARWEADGPATGHDGGTARRAAGTTSSPGSAAPGWNALPARFSGGVEAAGRRVPGQVRAVFLGQPVLQPAAHGRVRHSAASLGRADPGHFGRLTARRRRSGERPGGEEDRELLPYLGLAGVADDMPGIAVHADEPGDRALAAGLLRDLPTAACMTVSPRSSMPPGSAHRSLSSRRMSSTSPRSLVTPTVTAGRRSVASGTSGSS